MERQVTSMILDTRLREGRCKIKPRSPDSGSPEDPCVAPSDTAAVWATVPPRSLGRARRLRAGDELPVGSSSLSEPPSPHL